MCQQSSSLAGVSAPESALAVLNTLEAAGLEAWIVGGWVRDALRGEPCHDVDICCAGTWQQNEIALRAANITVIESGIRFGGITAVVNGERIEVTTYRLDGFYADGRHPESVTQATCVEDDLARRDFTVNAMAWHPRRGLLDLYDGQGDLRRHIIKAVGEPRRRFEEDALRMLRAVRFACRLGFDMDPVTAEALSSCAPLLNAVARERVGVELTGILASLRAHEALRHYPEIMCQAIGELAAMRGFDQHSRYHAYDVYEHTTHVLAAADEMVREQRIQGNHPELADAEAFLWSALLHDVGKPSCFTRGADGSGHFYKHPEVSAAMAQKILKRLAVSTDITRRACLLIKYHDTPLKPERTSLLRMLANLSVNGQYAPQLMYELLDLKCCDTLGKVSSCFYYIEALEHMRDMIRELVKNEEAYSIKTLAITGGDLIAAGIPAGPRIGMLLNRALEATMKGTVPNERMALLSYLDS